ncbi:arsenate reductase ArsC [candidate division WOR-3 bacterium]|nr:arsenate reductase ArsC [candidate division WOR-3 bacterium]
MTRILFACVGNSCRSQMAEAFCRELGRDVECASAGSKPAAEVQPDTIAVMKEAGIDISGARPGGFKDLPDLKYDYLVTMGCEVVCPFLPGATEIRWEIPDPFGKGIAEYRRVREIVRGEVAGLLEQLGLLRDH